MILSGVSIELLGLADLETQPGQLSSTESGGSSDLCDSRRAAIRSAVDGSDRTNGLDTEDRDTRDGRLKSQFAMRNPQVRGAKTPQAGVSRE